MIYTTKKLKRWSVVRWKKRGRRDRYGLVLSMKGIKDHNPAGSSWGGVYFKKPPVLWIPWPIGWLIEGAGMSRRKKGAKR